MSCLLKVLSVFELGQGLEGIKILIPKGSKGMGAASMLSEHQLESHIYIYNYEENPTTKLWGKKRERRGREFSEWRKGMEVG